MGDEKIPSAEHDATKTAADIPRTPSTQLPGMIGQYRIVGKLGEGGMGVVYEAEQQSPKREVAVKVVRGGRFVDKHQVRMFQREADTLARLKHPNIAAIYESGHTDDGRHFFAMELVRGETLGTYVKKRPKIDTREELCFRLVLFRKIVDAVHYAHQRGVIHRDLKPSNIIVTDERTSGDTSATGVRAPEIKILDFGLARITEIDVAAATMTTEVGVIKGTLPYMSPEQARGNPEEIDVRADVYALGVMLYELLAGQRPYDVLKKSLAEAVRVICEEPPRSLKSARVGVRKLDSDIDTIVGKALEKDADRRYGSAAALSEDIGRFLASLPILARPPSAIYQLRKFARRNRVLVGGLLTTFVVLAAGIVVSTVLGLGQAAQRRVAEQARTDLETVVRFQSDMLNKVDPHAMGRQLITDLRELVGEAYRKRGASVEEVESALGSLDTLMQDVNATNGALRLLEKNILEPASETIGEEFEDQPMVNARLRHAIGWTYRTLGMHERAEQELRAAVATLERHFGREDPKTFWVMNAIVTSLVVVLHEQGQFEEGDALALEALERQRRVLGEEHRATLASMQNLGRSYIDQGRYEEAEPLATTVLQVGRRVLGSEDPITLRAINNLGALYKLQERYDEAEVLYREAMELDRRVLGPESRELLLVMNNLGALYLSRGRYREAEDLFVEAHAIRRRVLGDDHPDTVQTLYNLSCLAMLRGDRDKALDFLREATKHGLRDAESIAADPDLEPLRGDPEFEAIVTEIKTRDGK